VYINKGTRGYEYGRQTSRHTDASWLAFSRVSGNELLNWELPQSTTYLTALHMDVPPLSPQIKQPRSV